MSLLEYADATTPFDISATVDEMDDGTGRVELALLDSLYDSAGVDALMHTYTTVVDALSRDPSLSVDRPGLFDPEMLRQAVRLGTGTPLDADQSQSQTISQRISYWIEVEPDAVAVKDQAGIALTYRQASLRADAIKRF